jgi:uncharacterized protein (TIGR02145 family)
MIVNLKVRLLAISFLCFLFSSCEEENKGDLIEPVPVVQTLPVVWTSATAASGGGIIEGQANVTKRGLVWSNSPNPKITDSKSEAGSGNGEFTSTLTSISNSNTYYVRAYAHTNSTVVYGNEVYLAGQGPTSGTISALNCTSANHNGSISQGSEASGVSSEISYTGGNGGNHNGQTVSSSGVNGLTATLAPGVFSTGSGTLTYTISGNPSSSGTASFAINIGGRLCTLTRTVSGGGQSGISAHTCGAANVHNPAKTYGSMSDQEGNVYKTIVIGTQEWMAENLKTTIYNNGEPIASVTESNLWAELAIFSLGAWCYYNNDSQYDCPYGKFYNWYAVADPRNICPTGWHVPTDAEWSTLINFLGGESLAGGKMKSISLQYWLSPNQDASNESGFSGLSGGVRDNNSGGFGSFGNIGYWWSSSESSAPDALALYLNYSDGNAGRYYFGKPVGFSVRCLRN